MIFAITQVSTPPQQQRPPVGSLGAEYPLIVGIGIGIAIASLRGKSQPDAKTAFTPVQRDVEVEPSYASYENTTPNLQQNFEVTASVEDGSYKWVNQVLKLPFRILSGMQGSGKSTLERFMIAQLVKDGWHVVCINPETNPNVWSGVEVLADAESISKFFQDFLQWVRDRQQEGRTQGIDEDDYLDAIAKKRTGRNGRVAIFLMETNTYEPHGVDPDAWANFLKQCLTNIRKWGFTACFTAHSDNQTSVASKLAGFSKLLDGQPRIDCIAVTNKNTGEATSSGEAWLKIKGIKDPSPIKVKLHNYPKTKDFRTSNEQPQIPTNVSDSTPTPDNSAERNRETELPTNTSVLNSKDEIEALANYIIKTFQDEGRSKLYNIPRQSKPVRNWLTKKHGSFNLDNPHLIIDLHILLGVLEYQGKALLYGKKDNQGLIVPSKDTEFEIIK
jgi:hypothetical protein